MRPRIPPRVRAAGGVVARRVLRDPSWRAPAPDRRGTGLTRVPRRATVAGTRLAPAIAVLCIGVLDLVATAGDWPLVVRGALDEPAHLLTAWLVLNCIPPARGRIWPWALLGAVLIDLDHVPLLLWGGPVTDFGGRPVTHSLATVAVLTAVALAVPRVRVGAGGLAVGVLLHLLRDLASSPGVPLLWPLRPENVLLPYWIYAVLVVAAAVVPLAVLAPARRSPRRSA